MNLFRLGGVALRLSQQLWKEGILPGSLFHLDALWLLDIVGGVGKYLLAAALEWADTTTVPCTKLRQQLRATVQKPEYLHAANVTDRVPNGALTPGNYPICLPIPDLPDKRRVSKGAGEGSVKGDIANYLD